MTVRIHLKKDNLDQESARFAMAALPKPAFLNSVPKSGSHLVRNIARMFVAPAQQYKVDFIQLPTLGVHRRAFAPEEKLLSWGHLIFTDISAIATRDVNHIVLVRDPYTWVLARARFFLSNEFQGNLNIIKNGAASIDDVIRMMIFGVIDRAPPMADIFTLNGVAWLGAGAHVVRYEDVLTQLKNLDSPDAERFFDALLGQMGIAPLPTDWRERIRIGSDRRYSGTSREQLTGDAIVPDELTPMQKRLINYAAPGLREILGYA